MQALLDTISAGNQDGTLLREATSQYLYASKRVDRLSSFEHKPASDVRVLNEIFFVQGLDSEDLLCEHFQSFDDEEEGEGVNMFEAFDAESYQKIAEVVFTPTECKERYWPHAFFDCAFDAVVTAVLDFVCAVLLRAVLNGVQSPPFGAVLTQGQRPPFGAVQTSTQTAEKDVKDLVNNYFCYLGLREGTHDKELAEEFEDAFGGMHEMLMAAIQ